MLIEHIQVSKATVNNRNIFTGLIHFQRTLLSILHLLELSLINVQSNLEVIMANLSVIFL
jgi:hypothetical protein